MGISFTGTYRLTTDGLLIHLFFRNGEQQPPEWLLQVVSYHETIHAFDDTNGRPSKGLPKAPEGFIYHAYGKNNIYHIAQTFYPIATEASYFADKRYGGGHPQTNGRELYTSTLTVMRFFPEQFLENLKGIQDPREKQIAANYASYCLNSLVTRARINVDEPELPYKKELFEALKLLIE